MSDYVTSTDDLNCRASTVLLVKRMADLLERHYPGWMWCVQPDDVGGVINLFSMRLSGEWGYRFRILDIQGDPKVCDRVIVAAGGEILERFYVPRGTYRYEDWKQSPKDIAGIARADITDKPKGTQRFQRDEALSNALQHGMAKLRVRDTPTATGVYRELGLQIGGDNG
jgi:hypothetical protein